MALKNLFGKGKPAGVKVRPDRMDNYFYHYNQGRNKALIEFDPAYQEILHRGSLNDGCRVIIYVDPQHTQADGLPTDAHLQTVRNLEKDLSAHLEKKGVHAKLVGTMVYGGMMDVVYMVNGLSNFQSALNAWKKRQKAYRIDEMSLVGWTFYDEKLVPKGFHWHQISDSRVVEQLKAAGTNMEVGHWTEHTILGAPEKLQQVLEQMKPLDYYLVSMEGETLVLEKNLQLKAEEIFEAIAPLRVLCENLGIVYDGWGALVVQDKIISGTIQDGHGVYQWETGLYYDGPWKNGMRNGEGKMKFKDGSWYEGGFVNNKRTGHGHMVWAHNESYTGGFIGGELHGQGTYHWPSGNKYTGDWFHGERTGKGQFWWANGDTYVGDFIQNKRTGKGRYDWNNGDWYEGDFVGGKLHGYGKEYLLAKNVFIEGEYVDGNCSKEHRRYPGPTRAGANPNAGSGGGAPAPEANAPAGGAPVKSSGGFNPGQAPAQESPKEEAKPKEKPVRPQDISWTILDASETEVDEKISREARFAAAKGLRTFLFFRSIEAPGHNNLRQLLVHEPFAKAFLKVHVLELGDAHEASLKELGFEASGETGLWALNPNGSNAERPFEGELNGEDPDQLARALQSYFYP